MQPTYPPYISPVPARGGLQPALSPVPSIAYAPVLTPAQYLPHVAGSPAPLVGRGTPAPAGQLTAAQMAYLNQQRPASLQPYPAVVHGMPPYRAVAPSTSQGISPAIPQRVQPGSRLPPQQPGTYWPS